jgi:hypothetical protein
MGASERLQVRVNDELVLDAGACKDVTRALDRSDSSVHR